MLFRK